MLYSQEKMGEDVLPKANKAKREYKTFKEFFEDPKAADQSKLDMVGQFIRFETLNGVTKSELQAALKWLFEQNYEFVQSRDLPGFSLIRGGKEEVNAYEEGRNDQGHGQAPRDPGSA